MKYLSLILLVLVLIACQSKSSNILENQIEVSINKDSTALIFSNINEYILKELSSDSISDDIWKSSFAIYPKAQDEDLQDLEKEIAGKFITENNNVVFKPNKPFEKGKAYLIELYLQNPSGEITDNLKSDHSLFNRTAIQKTISF